MGSVASDFNRGCETLWEDSVFSSQWKNLQDKDRNVIIYDEWIQIKHSFWLKSKICKMRVKFGSFTKLDTFLISKFSYLKS